MTQARGTRTFNRLQLLVEDGAVVQPARLVRFRGGHAERTPGPLGLAHRLQQAPANERTSRTRRQCVWHTDKGSGERASNAARRDFHARPRTAHPHANGACHARPLTGACNARLLRAPTRARLLVRRPDRSKSASTLATTSTLRCCLVSWSLRRRKSSSSSSRRWYSLSVLRSRNQAHGGVQDGRRSGRPWGSSAAGAVGAVYAHGRAPACLLQPLVQLAEHLAELNEALSDLHGQACRVDADLAQPDELRHVALHVRQQPLHVLAVIVPVRTAAWGESEGRPQARA